jgi:hypothetical protein
MQRLRENNSSTGGVLPVMRAPLSDAEKACAPVSEVLIGKASTRSTPRSANPQA